jgi:hypothetical protein
VNVSRIDTGEAHELKKSVQQLSFEFAGAASDGLALWREQQQETLRRLGAELGLPLGAFCEVVLTTGLLVRGRLLLDEDDLFPSTRRDEAKFRIGNVNFSFAESPPASALIDPSKSACWLG